MIVKYKETELLDEASLSETFQSVLERVREHLQEACFSDKPEPAWLPSHAIELPVDGELNAHVDSVRFSGDIVSGLSLSSPSIMRLRDEDAKETDEYVDLFLPPRSLYVLSGPSRFQYTHELLPSGAAFEGNPITRELRWSIIFRDAKGRFNRVDGILEREHEINAFTWNYRLIFVRIISAA